MKEPFYPVPFSHAGAVDVARCNETTAKFGIKLSQSDAAVLADARARTLKRTGRVEFEGGVVEKLIIAFSDSPYLMQDGFTEAMEEIIEIFYEFKNDSLDEVDDDDAIDLMRCIFDRDCVGSIDALRDDIGRYARRIRFGETDEDEELYDE